VNKDGINGCVRRSHGYDETDETGSSHQDESRSSSATRRIWLDELKCTGDEEELGECRRTEWGVTDCGHKEDVGCICTPRPTVSPVTGL